MKNLCCLVVLIGLLLAQATFAAASLSGPETARLFVDEMSRVFDIHFEGDTSLLEEGTHFSGLVMDEDNMQLRFESQAFFEATGKKLYCLVGRDRAEIILADTWDDAANDVATKLMGPLLSFRSEASTESGSNIVFRSSPLEFEDCYYEIVLDVKGQKSLPIITLGYYRVERARKTQTFSVPGARWQVDTSKKKRGGPGAKVTMSLDQENRADTFGTQILEVRFDSGKPLLIFTPELYCMWADANGGKDGNGYKGYIQELKEVRVDQVILPAFSGWRKPDDKIPLPGLSIPLDQDSLALMEKGKFIKFDLVTTLDERVQVIFPLKNAGKTIASSAMLAELFKASPLMAPVAMEDYQGVKEAIAQGIDVNLALPNGMTALSIAVKMKDPEMIRLLGTAPDLNTQVRTQDGDGFLHVAAHYYRGTEVLKALVDIGCDPDMRDSTGRTPLSRTVSYQGFGKIECLLNSGAELDAPDNEGYTPLHHTVRNRFSSPDETTFLLEAGADKNSAATSGDTPLMVAVNNQCWGHIQALLAADVNIGLKNKAGLTALDMAKSYRDSDDLTKQIPTLILQGEDAVEKTKDAYNNLVTLLENKSVYHYGFQNATDETVYLAMRILNRSDSWTTKYWFKLEPWTKAIVARSPNRISYFFAESKSYSWTGTDNTRTINGKKYRMRKLELKSTDKGRPKYYKLN